MWTTIDPATGDYVMEVLPYARGGVPEGEFGVFERTDSLATPVFLRLFSQRGSFVDDREFGSRLHELYRMKSPSSAAKLVPDMVREALQPLIDDGLVVRVDTTAEPEITTEDGVTRRGVGFEVVVYDSGDRPYRFRAWQEVGG